MLPMSDPVHTRLTRKKRIREYNARGEIYSWLRAHHGDVARCRDVERRPWAVLIRDMVADGIRREDGKEPTVKNVSRVWERVCRDIEADAKAARPTREFPSRNSRDWRPQVVAQPPVVSPLPIRPPARPAGTALQTSATKPALRSPAEVQAMIDEVFEDSDASDRRKLGW